MRKPALATVTVTSAFPASRGGDAVALVFEYMAATQAENGRPVPSGVAELPAVLRRECSSLQDVYRSPGVFLIADRGGQPAGCAGLCALPSGRMAEVRRLYVRPAHRGNGIARTLISHAHHHAARHGITSLILDVLPARTAVISFYRQLGYTETEPFRAEPPVPMIYMERAVTTSDILSRPLCPSHHRHLPKRGVAASWSGH
jgi:N-acetylglutamate synthase-like GNAT family acetyltransferase